MWLEQATEGRDACEGMFGLDQIKVHILMGTWVTLQEVQNEGRWRKKVIDLAHNALQLQCVPRGTAKSKFT